MNRKVFRVHECQTCGDVRFVPFFCSKDRMNSREVEA